MHMLWEYRSERWPILLTDILKNALKAAYLSASIQDYLNLALEALGPATTFSTERKTFVFENIINILQVCRIDFLFCKNFFYTMKIKIFYQKQPPNPEPDLPEDLKSSAVNKWSSQVNRNEPFIFTIDDDNATSFIEVKARFTQSKYNINSTISIEIFIRYIYYFINIITKIIDFAE